MEKKGSKQVEDGVNELSDFVLKNRNRRVTSNLVNDFIDCMLKCEGFKNQYTVKDQYTVSSFMKPVKDIFDAVNEKQKGLRI